MTKGLDIKNTVAAILISLFCIFVPALFYKNNTVTLVLFLIGTAVALSLWHDKIDCLFFGMGMIAGVVTESVCVNFGVWSYANPQIFGLPVWLILAWGLFMLVINRVGKIVEGLPLFKKF
jgi:hypothetical protein